MRTASVPERRQDLRGLRKAIFLVLGEKQLSVGDDVEHAAAPLDERGLVAGLSCDVGRQTGGLRLVVSDAAVGDRDLHRCL
jgi:hypothetical protein